MESDTDISNNTRRISVISACAELDLGKSDRNSKMPKSESSN